MYPNRKGSNNPECHYSFKIDIEKLNEMKLMKGETEEKEADQNKKESENGRLYPPPKDEEVKLVYEERKQKNKTIGSKIKPEFVGNTYDNEEDLFKAKPAAKISRDSEVLNTVTEDDGTENKSMFSSRASYLEEPERFRFKVNDSEGKSVNVSNQISIEKEPASKSKLFN